jgi:hypothetical protein
MHDDLARLVYQVADSIIAQEPGIALLGHDDALLRDVLDGAIASLADCPVRFVRLEEIPDSSADSGGEGALDERGLEAAEPDSETRNAVATSEASVVLVAEHAETWSAPGLKRLREAVMCIDPGPARRQILLLGHPGLETRLFSDELAGIGDRVTTVLRLNERNLPVPVEQPVVLPSSPAMPALEAVPVQVQERRRFPLRAVVFAGAAIVIVAGIGIGGKVGDVTWPAASVNRPSTGAATGSDGLRGILPAPAAIGQTTPPSPTPPADIGSQADPQAASAEPVPAARVPADLGKLRADFDKFLSETQKEPLSDAERERLFERFVQWRYGTAAAANSPAPRN